jgi:hypothetical protein
MQPPGLIRKLIHTVYTADARTPLHGQVIDSTLIEKYEYIGVVIFSHFTLPNCAQIFVTLIRLFCHSLSGEI